MTQATKHTPMLPFNGGYYGKVTSETSIELFSSDGYLLATFSDVSLAEAVEAAKNAAEELAGEEGAAK